MCEYDDFDPYSPPRGSFFRHRHTAGACRMQFVARRNVVEGFLVGAPGARPTRDGGACIRRTADCDRARCFTVEIVDVHAGGCAESRIEPYVLRAPGSRVGTCRSVAFHRRDRDLHADIGHRCRSHRSAGIRKPDLLSLPTSVARSLAKAPRVSEDAVSRNARTTCIDRTGSAPCVTTGNLLPLATATWTS